MQHPARVAPAPSDDAARPPNTPPSDLIDRPTDEGVKPHLRSISPSERPPRKRLTTAQRDLAAYLEKHVPLDRNRPQGGNFFGARQFVAKFGARLVSQAINDMLDADDRFGPRWKAGIISPARYLNWYVRQLAEGQS